MPSRGMTNDPAERQRMTNEIRNLKTEKRRENWIRYSSFEILSTFVINSAPDLRLPQLA